MSEEQRAPLLGYEDFRILLDEEAEDLGVDDESSEGRHAWDAMNAAGNAIREYYETKITSGELMVVKTVGIDADGNCTGCGWDADHRYPFSVCCPGCGAKIKSP